MASSTAVFGFVSRPARALRRPQTGVGFDASSATLGTAREGNALPTAIAQRFHARAAIRSSNSSSISANSLDQLKAVRKILLIAQ